MCVCFLSEERGASIRGAPWARMWARNKRRIRWRCAGALAIIDTRPTLLYSSTSDVPERWR